MAMRPLSEMEACVLALIWSGGPSTPYAVRQVFLKSPSPQWSGSAGSIYPLVERLERGRLIRSSAHATGRRRAQLYSLTKSGAGALEKWLATTAAEWVAGVPPDPLRTRVRFLGALPPGRRQALLDVAQQNVERQLDAVRRDCRRCREEGDPEYWMARGAVLAMQARRAWLRELLAAERPPTPQSLGRDSSPVNMGLRPTNRDESPRGARFSVPLSASADSRAEARGARHGELKFAAAR